MLPTLECLSIVNKPFLIGVVALCLSACAVVAPNEQPTAQSLVGTWAVDLRPRPDSPVYLKEFIVASVSGSIFQGTFYDAPITEGRINADWGAVRIAFVTSDGSGPYNHSAVLSGRKLEGLTNVTGRGFLAYWSATKQ